MLRLAAGRQTATASWRCGGGIEIIISRACARVAMMRPSFKIIGSVSLRDHGMAGKARRGPLRSARTVEPMAADMLKGDLRSQSPARWRGSIAQTSEFRSFPNIFNLNQIRP